MLKLFLSLCASLLFFPVHAQDMFPEDSLENKYLAPLPIYIEGKIGGFVPLSHKFQKIYSRVEFLGGFEATYALTDAISAWASVSYVWDHGSSRGLHYSSKMSLIPLGFGLKYFLPSCCGNIYVGGGAQYTRLHTHDDSPYVIRHVNQWGWGAIAKVGKLICFSNRFFVDLFAEYSYLNMSFHKSHHETVHRHDADLSSLTVGLGIAYQL